MLYPALSIVTLLLYLLNSALLLKQIISKTHPGTPRYPLISITIIACVLHAVINYYTIFDHAVINYSFFNMLSLLALILNLLFLITLFKHPLETLGIIIYPYSALTLFLQFIFHQAPSYTAVPNKLLEMHILLSLLAYGLLSIAAIQTVLLIIQNYFLRHQHPGGFIRTFPPLETMELLLFKMISTGFIFLSFSLLSGFIFIDDIFGQHLVHKTVLSIIAWCIFGIILFGHYHFGWRGKKANYWILGGFSFLVLAYFGSKLVLELVLSQ